MGGLGSDAHVPIGSQVSPLAANNDESSRQHWKLLKGADFLLRLLAFALCMSVLVLLKQNEQTTVIAPGIVLKARYDNTKAPKALLVVVSICLAYSAIQAAVSLFTFCKQRLRLLDANAVAWAIFLADQLLTYLLLGAASATAEAAYIAKHGENKVQWKAVCAPFRRFCDHFAATVFISFVAVIALAFSCGISAYYLFRRYSAPAPSVFKS